MNSHCFSHAEVWALRRAIQVCFPCTGRVFGIVVTLENGAADKEVPTLTESLNVQLQSNDECSWRQTPSRDRKKMLMIVVALLHCFLLAALVQSAPVSSPSNPSQTFKEVVERVMRLVEKIRKDVRSVHGSIINIDGLTLDPSSQTGQLEMMRITLGIPDTPVLKELSEQFTADMCVSRMLAGGRLYQGLLVDLSGRLGGLEALSAELRDLVTHINQMKDAAQLSSDSSDQSSLDLTLNLHGNYDVQVAAHLTLCQLLEFCHDLIRSLRNMAETQMARGTR